MRFLYVTTIGSTMSFFVNLIDNLIAEGHSVDIACNDSVKNVPEHFHRAGCKVFSIDCSRSPFDIGNIKAIGQIKRIVAENNYDIVHCHTPIAAACARLACQKARKKGTKVFYTAHGFHFFRGAPIKNWMIYYPVEKLCARFTDVLITINNEDYERARKKLKAKKVEYVPGVGVDVNKFISVTVDKKQKRKELGIPENAFLLLSVGELNTNKNHQLIMRSFAKLNDDKIHYMIAGRGEKAEYLLSLAEQLGVADRFHLLGYRSDVKELYAVSDAFCFPSYREGLAVSVVEAMLNRLPVVGSEIRGVSDYNINGNGGYTYSPDDVDGFANGIKSLIDYPEMCENMGKHNFELAKKYDVNIINEQMKKLYHEGCK